MSITVPAAHKIVNEDPPIKFLAAAVISIMLISSLFSTHDPRTMTLTAALAAVSLLASQSSTLSLRLVAVCSVYATVIASSIFGDFFLSESSVFVLGLFFLTGYALVADKDVLTVSLISLLLLPLDTGAALVWAVLALITLVVYGSVGNGLEDSEDKEKLKVYCLLVSLTVAAVFLLSGSPDETIILPGKDYFYGGLYQQV